MEQEAKRLVATLSSRLDETSWGTIDCVLQLADPDYVFMPSDPLGLQTFLDGAPPHVLHYFETATDKRRKQVGNDLTSLHGRWKDDD
jgi:hypothetical protein